MRKTIRFGRLRLTEANGASEVYGDGSGPELHMRLLPGAALKLALNPNLKLGECFVDGEVILEQGDVYELLDLIARNLLATRKPRTWFDDLRFATLRRLQQMNDRVAARRNVAHHYDLSYDLYRRFLDPDMQYSCAYFPYPGASLEEAQVAKKAHLAAKLDLKPGQKLLDIGSGWGGLGLTLAEDIPDGQVLGVTLSQEQLAIARQRAEAKGVANSVRFELCDYRDVTGPFDRIVSVGMFEHVGQPHYQEFFDHIARLLADDGVAVIHSIGRKNPPGITQPWIAKYIFPGGYIPALSEVLPAIERAGLWVTDIEILRLHYAETLREWRRRFIAQREEIAGLYDERFCRMWEYYLAISEIGFRHLGLMNFQVQLTKKVDALPLTRDYITAAEAPRVPKRGSRAA